MGLDVVELVLAVEDEFQISFDQADLVHITTPRQLAYYVEKMLGMHSKEQPDIAQSKFYELREALVAQTGIPKHSIQPDTPLDAIFSSDKQIRKKQWHDIEQVVATYGLPELEQNFALKALHLLLMLIYGLLFFAITIYTAFTFESFLLQGAIFTILLIAFLLPVKILESTFQRTFSSSYTEIPKPLKTVHDLLPFIDYPKGAEFLPVSKEVLLKVRQITAVQLDLSLDEVGADDRFIEDLNAG